MKGLYIHIPFCKSKCKYCGFFSKSEYDDDLIEKYLNQVINLIDKFDDFEFHTMYVGGGTPSVIPYKILDNFFSKLFKKISPERIAEFTVEANPESLSEDFLYVLKNYNVSRVSLGLQSMDDRVLKYLGRIHSREQSVIAVKNVRKILTDAALNLDFMYDIPKVDESTILKSLKDIVKLNPEHISAYSYSFDTDFLSEKYEVQKTSYLKVKHFLERNNFKKYEISNFAKNGFESVHNKIYWTMQEYLGVGAAASSMILYNGKRVRFSFAKNIFSFINTPYITDFEIVLDWGELLKEDLIFGLRMLDGVNIKKVTDRYADKVENFLEKCDKLFQENFLQIKGENLCLTEKGELFLDYVQQFLWEL
ncbi:MAG: oxygen-independent coproporphyrinogen oxidase [Deferribacteraceae bacterium]|jgi:oxygen-independent coproporphyrinogen-3 oxidase|nr:oxygen-independent coproporphyrinogen oxidase [Deferribacteraceae bacterium]